MVWHLFIALMLATPAGPSKVVINTGATFKTKAACVATFPSINMITEHTVIEANARCFDTKEAEAIMGLVPQDKQVQR